MHTFADYLNLIKGNKNITFLTGAGVSTLSGIKDFRSANGLYNEENAISPEEILSSDYFYEHTKEFYNYYRRAFDLRKYEPNIVHKHIAELENKGKNVSIITQNVDGLHTKAGSTDVIEFHGTIFKNKCLACGKEHSADFVFDSNGIPKCECGGIIKPEIVLYGEIPSDTNKALRKVHRADVLVAIGSSLLVSPANSFIYDALYDGTPVVIINRAETPFDRYATVLIHDDFKNVFKEGE